MIKEMKNPNDTHKYNAKSCIEAINNKLRKDGTYPMCKGQNVKINNFHFMNFVKYFDLKSNERMCFVFDKQAKQPQYRYSQQVIDFIYEEIKKNPETILDDLREKLKLKKSGSQP